MHVHKHTRKHTNTQDTHTHIQTKEKLTHINTQILTHTVPEQLRNTHTHLSQGLGVS